MKYAEGTTGRIFTVRFEHGDDIAESVADLAEREKISLAVISFLGALEEGSIVTGPRTLELPATPNWTDFANGWETVGFGTITRDTGGQIKVHLHGALGKDRNALAGCIRKGSKVFITVEAMVTEIKGVSAVRARDPYTGHGLICFE